MKINRLSVIVLILTSMGCHGKPGRYDRTFNLDIADNTTHNKLYVEIYSAGIWNNLTKNYLTDSLNFRIYTGTFDDESEYLYYKLTGDSIAIEKRGRANEVFKVDTVFVNGKTELVPNLKYSPVVTSKVFYSLEALRKSHKFER